MRERRAVQRSAGQASPPRRIPRPISTLCVVLLVRRRGTPADVTLESTPSAA